MQQIDVYTKPGCPRCQRVKRELSDLGVKYTELLIGENVTRDYVVEKFPGQMQLPILVMGDTVIADLKDIS